MINCTLKLTALINWRINISHITFRYFVAWTPKLPLRCFLFLWRISGNVSTFLPFFFVDKSVLKGLISESRKSLEVPALMKYDSVTRVNCGRTEIFLEKRGCEQTIHIFSLRRSTCWGPQLWKNEMCDGWISIDWNVARYINSSSWSVMWNIWSLLWPRQQARHIIRGAKHFFQ